MKFTSPSGVILDGLVGELDTELPVLQTSSLETEYHLLESLIREFRSEICVWEVENFIVRPAILTVVVFLVVMFFRFTLAGR